MNAPDAKHWREFLTSLEAVELEALEANAQSIDRKRRGLTAEISLIRGRCVQRRRYEAAKLRRPAA